MLLTWLQQTPGWVQPGASLDMNFAGGTYYPAGVGSLLTTTRAQTVSSYATTSTGSLMAFAANTPRITDLGLLVEQGATNLCLQSQTFDNSSWAKTNASVTANAVTAPDGTLTADKLVENSSNGFHQVTQSITVVSATTYTWCQYLEAGERTGYSISLSGATTTGIIVNGLLTGAGTATVAQGSGSPSATITAVSNGFYRIVITFTTNATALTVAIRLATDGAGNTFYTGDGTSGYYVWQADLVALGFATSPIPTTTVAVARAADNIQPIGPAITALQSATGWMRVATPLGISQLNSYVVTRQQTNSNDVLMQAAASTTGRVFVNGSGLAAATIGGAGTWSGSVRAGSTWDGSGIDVALNGGTVGTTATPFASGPSPDPYIGSRNGSTGTTFINGYISRLTVGSTKLTNAALQALTA